MNTVRFTQEEVAFLQQENVPVAIARAQFFGSVRAVLALKGVKLDGANIEISPDLTSATIHRVPTVPPVE